MGRTRRFDPPGLPRHIVQRGNNRMPCFAVPGDYEMYLAYLEKGARRTSCRIHGFALMTNHVHILATPPCAGAVSRLMQFTGSRYVAYFNRRHRRTGTLWEGRFRSCVVDSDAYALRCLRYIELNPVRAGIALAPEDYRWSSYRSNALGVRSPLLELHESYARLGRDDGSRRRAYAALVASAISASELADIRMQTRKGGAFGCGDFRARIAALHGRSTPTRERGRPRLAA